MTPILAALLLVGITVVGGISLYVWESGLLGGASGTALPTAESMQLLGYDTRDATDLTSLSTLDNGVSDPTSLVAGSEFMVLKVRNTTIQEILIDKVIIIGQEHTWDSDAASATEAPSQGEFQVYQKLSGDPSVQKTTPSLAPDEDARIAVKLSDSLPVDISLGRNVLVNIKTTNGSKFNFNVVTGILNGAGDNSSSGGGSGGSSTCNGQSATILGTSNSEILNGTSGDDVIVGLDGNDIIYGNGGDDIICGDDGNDELYGHAGDDTILGGDGNDFIDGSSGDDTLYGDGGNDFVNGNSGDDTCDGGAGTNQLLSCE